MGNPGASAFERALAAEVLASERLRVRVLGPFVLYEWVAMLILQRRHARGATLATPLRFANATIETSLPSVLLWTVSQHWRPEVALGAWPSTLFFSDAVASALGHDRGPATPLGEVPIRGYQGPVRVWRLA